MFTEYEVETFLSIPEIQECVFQQRKEFITTEAQFLEISDHDFLSLILMTPAVGIANSNGSISLFEEMALNKMARKMSKGGYFMKSDPVSKGMKFLIKGFNKWEEPFLETIKMIMNRTFNKKNIQTTLKDNEEPSFHNFPRELMVVPHILVRYLTAFFLQGSTEIVEKHSILKVELDKIKELGNRLDLADLNIFKAFCTTFEVK